MIEHDDPEKGDDESLDTVDDDEQAPSGRKKRIHQRVKLVVEVGADSANRFWSGLTENISAGGLFIATESPFEVGEELTVNLQLKGRRGAQAIHCRVCWLREFPDGGLLPGMGVQFVDMSADQATAIKKYIETEDLEVLFWDEA